MKKLLGACCLGLDASGVTGVWCECCLAQKVSGVKVARCKRCLV